MHHYLPLVVWLRQLPGHNGWLKEPVRLQWVGVGRRRVAFDCCKVQPSISSRVAVRATRQDSSRPSLLRVLVRRIYSRRRPIRFVLQGIFLGKLPLKSLKLSGPVVRRSAQLHSSQWRVAVRRWPEELRCQTLFVQRSDLAAPLRYAALAQIEAKPKPRRRLVNVSSFQGHGR